MPWKDGTLVYERRIAFVKARESGLYTKTELAAQFGVCRNNAYKWLRRYREEGIDGLRDRRRAPLKPRKIVPELVERILKARDENPRWGPRKLKALLELHQPDKPWPSRSTIGDILKRHGRIEERRRRRKHTHPGKPVVSMDAPNVVWCVDYKGHFRLGSGEYCYPLTVSDGSTRYLLGCRALTATDTEQARVVFVELFREYGLPEYILSDNGSPFASSGRAGLTRLSVWWVRLGIIPKRIQPSSPHQNGRHERMHRTLKAATTKPPAPTMQQIRFDQFRKMYNDRHPHQALQMKRPGDLYLRSEREYPEVLPKQEYPPHATIRKVSSQGTIRWRRTGILSTLHWPGSM